MKILIAEDEEVLAKVFEEKFKKAQFDVRLVADGEEALKELKSFKPDVMVLDLMMPRKDGFEVLEAMKRDPSLPKPPVVVVSNLGEDSDIKKALQLGAADYFIKVQHPINEIVEKIRAVAIRAR